MLDITLKELNLNMINFLKKFNKNLKHGTLFFQFPNGESYIY